MRLWSDNFEDGGLIPAQCAFAVIDPHTRVALSGNRNPHLAWDDVPAGTESLILFCYDVDAPTVGTNVNKDGLVVPENLPRTHFYHWTLTDIPLVMQTITEGTFSHGVTAHGKSGPIAPFAFKNGIEHHLRQGVNDYTSWFAGDPAMAGEYYGYDGPCPPWNDLRVHTYIFCLYALDVAQLPLETRFTGRDAHQAMHGHILDEAQIFGVYSLNPAVAALLTP